MEEDYRICRKCGKTLPVQGNFKRTRWGSVSTVCNCCAAAKQRITKEQKRNEREVNIKSQVQDARQLKLNDFTARELMKELARRGYEGKLTFTEVKTIDITNF